MKRYILLSLLSIVCVWQAVAQQSAEAANILDRTAQAFEKAGGVKATFRLEALRRGQSLGAANGEIELKGERFYLRTDEYMSWFDGKTQWVYMPASEEVTVSRPTQAELQSVNPYMLLYIYKKGFDYVMGDKNSFQGKPVYSVELKATDKRNDLSHIVLYVDKATYQPVFVKVMLRDQTINEIVIKNYQAGVKLPESRFVFNPQNYPDVEVIDLR